MLLSLKLFSLSNAEYRYEWTRYFYKYYFHEKWWWDQRCIFQNICKLCSLLEMSQLASNAKINVFKIVPEILMGFICKVIIFQLTMNGICLVRTKCVEVMEQIECEHLMEPFIIFEGIASIHLLRMKIFGKSL